MKPTLIPELKVENFEQSLNFYTLLAGFKILYDRPENEFAMLERDGAQLMIEGIANNRSWGSTEKPFGRGVNFQIEVKDAQRLYDNFKEARYPIFFEMEEKWYRKGSGKTGNKQFLVEDPDGYLLRFFEDITKL